MFPIERPRRSVRCQTVPPCSGMTITSTWTPWSGAFVAKAVVASRIYIANSIDASGRAPVHAEWRVPQICAVIEHEKGTAYLAVQRRRKAVTLEKPLPDDALRIVQEAVRRRGGRDGSGVREKPFTEADWTDETNRDDTSPYDRAKTIAERAAWAWHKADGGGLELVAVNPAWFSGRISRLRLRRLGSSWTAGTLQAVTVALAQPGSLCLGAQLQYHSPR
jgi:hypothetical protein